MKDKFVLLGVRKDDLVEAVAGLNQLKPIIQKQLLLINDEGKGKEDSEEVGKHFETAVTAMEMLLGQIQKAEEKEGMKNVLKVLNELEISDHDNDGEDLVYLHICDTEENIETLRKVGANDEDIEKMRENMQGTDELDIVEFVFSKLKVDYWSPDKGFLLAEDN